jgi:hypothetical protein
MYLARIQVGADGVEVGVILEQQVDRDVSCSGDAVAGVSRLYDVGGSAIRPSNSKAYYLYTIHVSMRYIFFRA